MNNKYETWRLFNPKTATLMLQWLALCQPPLLVPQRQPSRTCPSPPLWLIPVYAYPL